MNPVFKFAFAATVCLYASAAIAAPQYFLVGDRDDPRCQFATIAQALQAASANGPELDYVMVANSAGYTGQALQVGNQSVLIEGGYANCDLDVDDAQPYADLLGNGNDPVIRIEPFVAGGYTVRLSNLRIRGGGRNDANGGGVRLVTTTGASVQLSLDRTEVTANRALSGGGIHAARSSATASGFALTLNPGTRIHDNTAASSGGGIGLSGGNTYIASDDVRIDNNTAAGAGGGISLSGGFVAVGNPDASPSRNDVVGARIENNRAGTYGGGIYLSGTDASVEARELIVDGNRAELGGGGITVSNGADLMMVRDVMNAFGWYCPPAFECTRISNNQVANGTANGTSGGGLAVYGSSSARLYQTIVRDNRAQDASAVLLDGAGILRTESTAFSGNRSHDIPGGQSASIRSRYAASSAPPKLHMSYTTFTDNLRFAADKVFRPAVVTLATNTDLKILSSALLDGGVAMSGSPALADCVVLGPDSVFVPGGSRITGTLSGPEGIFIAPGRRDWRPRFDSVLTDVCDASMAVPEFSDRDLRARCRDELKPDLWGACDIGAWENDQLFANGFDG